MNNFKYTKKEEGITVEKLLKVKEMMEQQVYGDMVFEIPVGMEDDLRVEIGTEFRSDAADAIRFNMRQG